MHLVMRQWETTIAIFPTIPHFIILSYIKKRLFRRSTSWPGRLLLFWMSHCLREHGRGDSEWCWMFYDCLLLCRTFPALLWDSDGEPGLPLLDLTAEELTHAHARTHVCVHRHARTHAHPLLTFRFKMPHIRSGKMLKGGSIQKLNK